MRRIKWRGERVRRIDRGKEMQVPMGKARVTVVVKEKAHVGRAWGERVATRKGKKRQKKKTKVQKKKS